MVLSRLYLSLPCYVIVIYYNYHFLTFMIFLNVIQIFVKIHTTQFF